LDFIVNLKCQTSSTIYMGCSDVSESEHIYGQILTTPSCVYGRVFTWTKMVDFNALIVWKTFIERHLFFDKVRSFSIVSCLYEIPKNDLVDVMKLWPPVTFPDVYCYLIETPGDFTGEKLKRIQLSDFRVGQATTDAEAQAYDSHDATSPLPSPSSLRLLPSPFLTRVLGYHHGKTVELKMFVGKLCN